MSLSNDSFLLQKPYLLLVKTKGLEPLNSSFYIILFGVLLCRLQVTSYLMFVFFFLVFLFSFFFYKFFIPFFFFFPCCLCLLLSLPSCFTCFLRQFFLLCALLLHCTLLLYFMFCNLTLPCCFILCLVVSFHALLLNHTLLFHFVPCYFPMFCYFVLCLIALPCFAPSRCITFSLP
jgi:hypothetical protein